MELFVLATKAFARRTRRGSSGLYFHMPHPTRSWGPREFFFGRCLQDEAGESTGSPTPILVRAWRIEQLCK